MNKEKFKYLYSFKYNNKEYIYLISKNYPFYFLEYNFSTKNFDFPDINTFKELYRKFYVDDTILSFDILNDLRNLKEKICNINIELTPLIKTTSGLISIILVLSMCGCGPKKDINNINNDETTVITDTQDKNQEIYNYFKKYDMEVVNKEYDGNDYIFVKNFVNTDNKHELTLQNYDEFRKYNNINFIPTWNDVIEVFKNNPNIDNEKKDIILDGISNLKNMEALKEMDLSVLFVNAKRMNIKYLTSEEMANTINRETVYAYFDSVTGTVYLPSDKPLKNFEFIHEVLGHGSLAYRDETEESLIVFDCTNYLMLPTDNRYTGYSVGVMVSEGGANMIAHLATNDYTVSSFYELYEEELRTIAALCDVSIGELFNYKGISLYDLMYKNGIDTPVEYIFKMDALYKGQLHCEFSDLMERLFVDATEEDFVNSNQDEQDKIIKATIDIIKDSHLKNNKELNFNYPGGSINYNFEQSANKYEDNMNKLRNGK